ncbi:ribosomal protein L11 methyltransferase [Idiomarina sp. A28L]|uniref:50S ribosomal protein L11 methyltransferase n=1 Tax=Idiomarina sp. A28L TaxID=1036674 RepID=UPI0002138AA0|nr:50S ribosomal protein L11 methyltransferase [Idiomarina sp. A28L]EGN75326.1 ribosomal protein L11 methyltransferase [Idiomarina sp. A28L]
MPWIQLTLTTKESYGRQLGDILMANKAQAVTYRDAKDAPIFEPAPGEVPLWELTQVTGLYPAETDMRAVINNLSKVGFLAKPLRYKTDQLEDKDWEREWMDNFKPIDFGNGLWVVPSWHQPPVADAANILLDPGMAFGTGTHPTTSLCLQWIAEQDLEAKSTVDFGCGSGILGIAALKRGAASCMGTDIDQQALKATRENAELNGVADKFSVYLPEDAPQEQVDVVIANILAGPLRELAPNLLAYLKPGGMIAMSGILKRQAEDVMAAYRPIIDFGPVREHDDWCFLHGTKVNS